jgi:hypothetical protein
MRREGTRAFRRRVFFGAHFGKRRSRQKIEPPPQAH